MYGNEEEVGIAIANSGLKREDIFISKLLNKVFQSSLRG